MHRQMELSLKPSKIHLFLTITIFSWGVFAIWYSGLGLLMKLPLTALILTAFVLEWLAWKKAPLALSVRKDKLYLHLPSGVAERKVEQVFLDGARIRLFWIQFSSHRFWKQRYLFQDSFSKRDWCAIRRAIKSAA